jgi:site-specific DNA-methyltransferase (adenine-specific)
MTIMPTLFCKQCGAASGMHYAPCTGEVAPAFDIRRIDVMEGLRSLPNDSVDLVATDPPYNSMNRHLKLGKGRIVGEYDKREDEASEWFAEFDDTRENYMQFLAECARVMRHDGHIFLMFDTFTLLTLGAVVHEYFDVKGVVVWDKVNIGMGHYFRRRHEFVLFATQKGSKRKLTRKNIPDVWSIKRIHRAAYPTQKPVELFEAMIDASLLPNTGGLVLDPFVGSGSSAVAAKKQGHSFIGFDIAEKAIDMTYKRLASV